MRNPFKTRRKTIVTVGVSSSLLFETDKVPTLQDRIMAEAYPMLSGVPSRSAYDIMEDRFLRGSVTSLKRLYKVIRDEYPAGMPDTYINAIDNEPVPPEATQFDFVPSVQLKHRGKWYLDEIPAIKDSITKATKILGLDPDSIKDSYTVSEDNTLWGAYVACGVPLHLEDESLNDYLFRFLDKLHSNNVSRLNIEEDDDQQNSYELTVEYLTREVSETSDYPVNYVVKEFSTEPTSTAICQYTDDGSPIGEYIDDVFVQSCPTGTYDVEVLTVSKQISENEYVTYRAENLSIYKSVAKAKKYMVDYSCPPITNTHHYEGAGSGQYYEIELKGEIYRNTLNFVSWEDGEGNIFYNPSWSGWKQLDNSSAGDISGSQAGTITRFTFIQNTDVQTRTYKITSETCTTETFVNPDTGLPYEVTTCTPNFELVEGFEGTGEREEDTGEIYYSTLIGRDRDNNRVAGSAQIGSSIDTDNLAYFPVDLNILKEMSGVHRLRVAEISWIFVTNAGRVDVIKIRWYQTGIFKLVTFVIIVVIAYYNPVLGAKLFTAWMVSMAVQMVLMQISDPKLRAAIQIALIVLAIYTGNLELATTADKLMLAVNAASIYNEYNLSVALAKLESDYNDFMSDSESALKEIEDLRAQLGLDEHTDIRSLLFLKQVVETPESFFGRTLGTDTTLASLDLDSKIDTNVTLEKLYN